MFCTRSSAQTYFKSDSPYRYTKLHTIVRRYGDDGDDHAFHFFDAHRCAFCGRVNAHRGAGVKTDHGSHQHPTLEDEPRCSEREMRSGNRSIKFAPRYQSKYFPRDTSSCRCSGLHFPAAIFAFSLFGVLLRGYAPSKKGHAQRSGFVFQSRCWHCFR